MFFKSMRRSAVLWIMLCSYSSVSFAAQSAALSEDYTARVPARFGHGFMNAVFGWTALGVAPYQARQTGASGGEVFGSAVTAPFATTFLGVWDLATFWVPGEFGRSMGVPRHVWMAPEPQTTQPQPASAEGDLSNDPSVSPGA